MEKGRSLDTGNDDCIHWRKHTNEIKHVVANGKVLLEDYQFRTLERDEVLSDIQALSEIFEENRDIATKAKGTGVNL